MDSLWEVLSLNSLKSLKFLQTNPYLVSHSPALFSKYFILKIKLSTNILASGYCIYKGNPFSLYGENVFIGVQMLVIILLFIAFGKGNKIVYSVFFVLMIAAAYYISDPHHLPSFVVEHSIIVQTILSKIFIKLSLYFKNDTNHWSIQVKINRKPCFDNLGFVSFRKYWKNCNHCSRSLKWLQVPPFHGLSRYFKCYHCLPVLSLQKLKIKNPIKNRLILFFLIIRQNSYKLR